MALPSSRIQIHVRHDVLLEVIIRSISSQLYNLSINLAIKIDKIFEKIYKNHNSLYKFLPHQLDDDR